MNDATRELGAALGVAVLGSIAASRYSAEIAPSLRASVPADQIVGRVLDRRRPARGLSHCTELPADALDDRRPRCVPDRPPPRGASSAPALAVASAAIVFRYLPHSLAPRGAMHGPLEGVRGSRRARPRRCPAGVRRRSRGVAGVITPDTKDWTWVLERPCPECGFDAAAFDAGAGWSDDPRQRRSAWQRRAARRTVAERPAADRCGRRSSTRATFATCSGSTTSGSAHARRGRPAVRELGPGRDRGHGPYGEQDPTTSPTSSRAGGRGWRSVSTRWPATSGAARNAQRRRPLHGRVVRPLPDPRSRPPPLGRGRRTAVTRVQGTMR